MKLPNISLTIILIILSSFVYGQRPGKEMILSDSSVNILIEPVKFVYKKSIQQTIMGAFQSSSNSDSLGMLQVNEAHLISIAVSFNISGEVDSVYFPFKMTETVKKYVKPTTEMRTAIKKSLYGVSTYKNVVILFPVLFNAVFQKQIEKQPFLEGFINIWPKLDKKDELKKIVFLEPYIFKIYEKRI